MTTLSEQKPPASAKKSFRFWLAASLLGLPLLLLTALLLATHFISSPAVKQKIQQTIAERTNAKIDWQTIGLSYFPSPAITLREVVLAVPDQLQGRVAELRISPEVLPLLTGKLRLARLLLERPEVSLELPAPPLAATPAPPKTQAARQESLTRLLTTLSQVAPDLVLVISGGRLATGGERQLQIEAENLDLQLALSANDPRSTRATLRGKVAALNIRRNDQREAILGVELAGSASMTDGALGVLLQRLAITEPRLALSGELSLAQNAPGITLSLSGKGIDVDATRRVALALAGDLPPVREIFDYLRGGTVPQITFQSRGDSVSSLGDWKNFRIAGRLEQGAVSIPAIKLDLAEVVAEVQIAEGVLTGTGMSARLEGSSGHDGTLKVGLPADNDLFQLELMLNADLAQTKKILERIVQNPAFNRELNQITHLQGTGIGKLTLGDSLARLAARVDARELNFTADYQRVPFPIRVTSGQVEFSKDRIRLKGWNGSVGHSNFAGLAAKVGLQGALTLDVRTGPLVLSLDELYPWLASIEAASSHLQGIKQIGGRLDLSRLNIIGDLDKPQQWQFDGTGAVSALRLTAAHLPAEIRVARGQVEFSKDRISLKGWNGSVGHSNFAGLTGKVGLQGTLTLDVSAGPLVLSLDELYPWLASIETASSHLQGIKQLGGRLDLSRLSFTGNFDKPQQWQFAAAGTVNALHLTGADLPAEIRLPEGDFILDTDQLTVKALTAESLDAHLALNGTFKGLARGLDRIDATLDGTLGKDAVDWLVDVFKVPAAYTLRTPLTLSALKIAWQRDAPTSCTGGLSVKDGPHLTLDVAYRPGQLQVRKLSVKDQHSDAVIALASVPDDFSLSFSGTLQNETLDALFVDRRFARGRLAGNFSVNAPDARIAEASASGHLEGSDLQIPLPAGDKVEIDHAALTAEDRRVRADLTTLSWRDYTWAPVKGTVEFSQGKAQIGLAEAKLCGIDSPGGLTIAGKDLMIDFTLFGNGLDVSKSYTCLTKGEVSMTGALDISSQIHAHGQEGELLRTLRGPLEMTFTNGVIQRDKVLARILEVLNVTQIVKGKLPDLASTGFAYTTITVRGEFENGKLRLDKLYMDGATLDILGNGQIDMDQQTVDVELLAAPFKTADSIIRFIPGINYLMGGTLVAIPVSIKGKLKDPQVSVLSASSVGSSLLKLGERTLKAPLKLIETILPGE